MFVLIYNVGTGIYTALGDSMTPFRFLVVSSLGNIGLDLLFVLVFRMGVAGFAEYLEDALSDYAEAEKADFDLIHGLDG